MLSKRALSARAVHAGTTVCLILMGLCWAPGNAAALDCSGLPTSFAGNQFPTGTFFSNFNNACYTIALGTGIGTAGKTGEYADLNSTYNQIYFKVNPSYQLIIVGSFPQARYFSVSLYDEHEAISQHITDANIVPLTSKYVNPYQPGMAYASGQQYAVPINFGGVPGTLQAGCMMNGFNVTMNGLDATQRHAGMDWNSDAGVFAKYPSYVDHVVDTPQHTNPNGGGIILIRSYLDDTAPGATTSPHIIVRDVASGCAYPAAYVMNTLQDIVTTNATTGSNWVVKSQCQAHNFYEDSYLPKLCWVSNPASLEWLRQTEYVPGNDPNTGYMDATVPAGLPAALAAAGEVMRIRFQLPTTPPTPCTNGCSRSGTEQMRYVSLSFENPGGITLASVADSAFIQQTLGGSGSSSGGYVTLIVGTGAAIPSWITPANYYTFLDLTAIPGYQNLDLLAMRNILPFSTFNCSGQYVPFRTLEETSFGGLMGGYLPVVDYPLASSLPPTATPLAQPDSCGMFPGGQAGVVPNCGVFNPPPIGITSVVTQCPAPGCNQFVVQPTPPMTIVGGGFGNFPNQVPYTGVSNYLEIVDITQGWNAGYGTDVCNVAISSWASNRIQLVANVNQNGQCPLAAGDQVTVKVWNPQSMKSAVFPLVVSSN
jgi:hypothetical protein